jgi:iron(III) transport system substrate-binding protein
VDVAFVNHYYLYEVLGEDPDAPVANRFLAPGDAGALVNSAGAGVLAASNKPTRAQRLVGFLVSEEGQRYFAENTAEYPLVDGVEPRHDLPALTELHGPDVALGELGGELERTLAMLNETGLTS